MHGWNPLTPKRGRLSLRELLFLYGLAFSLCSVFLLAGPTRVAKAASVVTNCSTYGVVGTPGDLADAISMGGNITFNCSGTIELPLTPHIDLLQDTFLDATGHSVTIHANFFGVFYINGGVNASLTGLTITGGNSMVPAKGIGIFNAGNLTITNSIITGNKIEANGVNRGAGIFNNNTGTLTLSNTIVSNNRLVSGPASQSQGAGIYNEGTLRINNNSKVTGNFAITGDTGGTTYGGGIFNIGTLELNDPTVSNNSVLAGKSSTGEGGGIYTTGPSVKLNRSVVSGNNVQADDGGISIGGGIYQNDGTIELNDSTVSHNSVISVFNLSGTIGGGIYSGGGSLEISRSTVSDNTVAISVGGLAAGGGIYLGNSQFIMGNSTVSGNKVINPGNLEYSHGGGIYSNNGNSFVAYSTLSGNEATTSGTNSTSKGGGIYLNTTAEMFMANSTVAENRVFDENTTENSGGGIYNEGKLTLTYATVTGNSADSTSGVSVGGGINSQGAGAVNYKSSIISLNFSKTANADANGGGYNNLGDSFLSYNASQMKLGPLMNNGGPTKTVALLPGSIAIDAAGNIECPATDQRGVARPYPVGGNCDSGAFEWIPTPVIDKNQMPPADLIAQLRVAPDREFSVQPDFNNLFTYTLTVKNIGTGTASAVYLQLPIDSNLEVGFATFTDPQAWVEKIVLDNSDGTPYIQIRLPDILPGQEQTAKVAFHAKTGAIAGSTIFTRFLAAWDDKTATAKKGHSNAVRVQLTASSNRDDSGGAVQYFTGLQSPTDGSSGVQVLADFYAPDEKVDFWYTDSQSNSTALGSGKADQAGNLAQPLNLAALQIGQTYVVAGYGSRSGVTGSVVVKVEATASGAKTFTLKPFKADLKALGKRP